MMRAHPVRGGVPSKGLFAITLLSIVAGSGVGFFWAMGGSLKSTLNVMSETLSDVSRSVWWGGSGTTQVLEAIPVELKGLIGGLAVFLVMLVFIARSMDSRS